MNTPRFLALLFIFCIIAVNASPVPMKKFRQQTKKFNTLTTKQEIDRHDFWTRVKSEAEQSVESKRSDCTDSETKSSANKQNVPVLPGQCFA